LPLRFLESQRRLPNGKILDLCFKDLERNNVLVVELKRSRITASAVSQLSGYLSELAVLEPESSFSGMLVGFGISNATQQEATRKGIQWKLLDEQELRVIAQRHHLPLDHASGDRPRAARTQKVVSKPLLSKSRPPTSPEIVEYLRNLDTKFPPGSINHNSHMNDIISYWSESCPSAEAERIKTAALLTKEVLELLPSAALSNRSSGRTDPYTTIRTLDGRVAAAMDARTRHVKFDFPLPPEVASASVNLKELRIWNPRGYSVWVQSRVGSGLSADRAFELLRIGLSFEFGELYKESGSGK